MKKIVLVLLLFSVSLGLSFIQDNSYAVDLTLPDSLDYSDRLTAVNVDQVFEFVKDGDFFVLSLKKSPHLLSGELSIEFAAGSFVGWYANGSSTMITTSTENQPAHLLTYLDLSGAYVDNGVYKIIMNSEVAYNAYAEQEINDNGERDIRFVFRSAPLYEDLFYENIEVEFEILSETFITQGTYDKLFDLTATGGDVFPIDLYINNVLIDTANLLKDYDRPNSFGLTTSNIGKSLIISNDDTIFIADYDFQVGDIVKLTENQLKSWDLSYSYGRLRTQTSNTYFYKYDEQSQRVYLQTSNISNTFNPALIEANEIITIQSPYKDFQVTYGTVGNPLQYLVDVDDVSVVQILKLGTSSLFNFYVYHWVNSEIELTTIPNVNLADRNSLRVNFSGGIRQAISGNAIIVGNVDDLNDITYYTDFLVAYDDIDGYISDQIYVINDGDYNAAVVGNYTITVGVEDSEGQGTEFTFTAIVADNAAPTLVGPNLSQSISYTETFNFTTYLASLIKLDNYYSDEEITITIQTNAYTANKAIPGTYNVVLRVKDGYNNYTDYTLVITVTDPVAPTFTGGLSTLSKSVNEVITLAQILATQIATDAIEGNVSASIAVVSDTYSGNESTPGNYSILIAAQDSKGNSVQKTIAINVFSGVPGWYLPDDGPIIIPDGSTLNFEQITAVLVSVGWVQPNIEILFVSSNYFGNEDKPGTYQLNVTLDGAPATYNLLVLNQGDNWFPDVPTPPLAAQPNTLMIVAIASAVVLAIGVTVFIIVKKRKSA